MMRSQSSRLAGAAGRIYEQLFRQILRGELAPNALLSESELAKRLESSRTPVREALLMLEGEGLVRRYPGRGYLVTEITPQDVDEIFELRITLEVLALRKAYAAISSPVLAGLELQLTKLKEGDSPDDYYAADRTLHELLAQYCGNARLQVFLNTLDSQIERVRYISARRPDRLKESRREHLDIIHALMERDLPKAEERLTLHIRNVGESTKTVCRLQQLRSSFSIYA